MGLGQILPISSPASNATWTLDFWGPALQCNDVAKEDRDRTWINIWNSYNASQTGPYTFLSWVPWSYLDGSVEGIPEPFLSQTDLHHVDINLPFLSNHTWDPPVIGPPASFLPTNGSASFFIAMFPEAQNFTVEGGGTADYPTWINDQGSGDSINSCEVQTMHEITDTGTGRCNGGSNSGLVTAAQIYVDSTLLRCDLLNKSYSVGFSYSGGSQEIHIPSDMTGNSRIMNSTGTFVGPQAEPQPNGLASNPRLPQPANCSTFFPYPGSETQSIEVESCIFDLDAIRQLSYQGIMAAFNRLVLGSVQTQDDYVDMNTSVMSTILATTREFTFLRNWSPSHGNLGDSGLVYGDLQAAISNDTEWLYPGLVKSNPSDPDVDLKSTLEQLFQNFTISLLAEPYLQ